MNRYDCLSIVTVESYKNNNHWDNVLIPYRPVFILKRLFSHREKLKISLNHFFLIRKNSSYSIGTMFNKGSYRDNRILKVILDKSLRDCSLRELL